MKPVCCNCSCGRLAFLIEVKAPRYGRIGELFFSVQAFGQQQRPVSGTVNIFAQISSEILAEV